MASGETAPALEDLIGDPVVARVVRLVGDGRYLESLTGLPGDEDDAAVAAVVALLESLLDRPSP